jgi:hypothetical protein
VGLPRPDFARLTERFSNLRVSERLRSIHVPDALSNRVGFSNGLSAAGGLTLPYKLAVVAVMMLVAGGTLVTFGSAGAETAPVSGVDGSPTTTVAGSVLPGTPEATPRVEGQVLPQTTYDFTPDTSILSAGDLLASLKLTDYSTDADDKSDDDDDKKDDDKSDDDKKNDDKKSSTSKSGNKTGTKTGTKTDDGKKDDDKSDGGSSDNGSGDGDGGSSDNGSDDGDDDNGSDDGDDDDDKSDDRKCKDAKSELVKKLCK